MKLHEKRFSAITSIAFLLCFCLSFSLEASGRYTDNSVLSKGHWVKIQIEKNGIYKLTYSELKNMGFDDPSKVAVYGYGGWPLEEDFTKPYVDDLPAVPVLRKDNYILFYGRGTTKWEYKEVSYRKDSKRNKFVHTNNPYSLYGYYFLTTSSEVKEMDIVPSETKDATIEFDYFDDYLLHEKDLVSVNKSGRELFGESLYSTVSIPFEKVEGILDTDAFVDCRLIAKTNDAKNFVLSINGEEVVKSYINGVSPNLDLYEYIKARSAEAYGIWKGRKENSFSVKVDYSEKGNNTAYLDYIYIQLQRSLQVYGQPTFFRTLSSIGNKSCFTIKNADANTIVLDVTDALNPRIIEGVLNESNFSFVIPKEDRLREFVVFRLDNSVPVISANNSQKVAEQNLHALRQADMVIISPSAFKSEAERLKQAHEEHDQLENILVVTPEEIYNEFSSGTPDATAYRRLMKMFYDRSKNEQSNAPKYLLLFGDGAYDNRFVSSEWKLFPSGMKNNMLLTYQTNESLDDTSYVVDDYFGLLDDNEGVNISNDIIDIGIGRFPVRTITEARNAVNKVISYMNAPVGDWKNKVCFIGDDGSNADQYATYHQKYADELADTLEENHAEYVSTKILFDAFKKDRSGKSSYPDIPPLIQKTLKEGCFMLNYTGHGSAKSLSEEAVITQSDIIQSTYKHLPIWITASCDFCPFDQVATSAGEDVFLNKVSGGIALFTTTRVAFSPDNKNINENLVKELFGSDNERKALGDIFLSSKQKPSLRKLGFSLIGDPALKLSYPKYRLRLSTINGKDVADSSFEFKSQDKGELEGIVCTASDDLLSDFNGVLNVRVFDALDEKETMGNNKISFKYGEKDGKPLYRDSVPKIRYKDYINTIFLGSDSVRNGRFKISFFVPKDISYKVGKNGKITMYAYESESKRDASGSFKKFSVFGTSDNPKDDNMPPEIRSLFLNDTTFIDGGDVNSTPYFYAKVWDESGINITESSIGHGITLSIDNNPNSSYILNSYYENIIGSDGEGMVKFGIPVLTPGLHHAEFKIWDIMNNSATYTFSFNVVEGLKPFITNVIATPTPARGNVEFHITHNRPESRMKVGIMVYDMTGRLHWKHEETGSSELFKDYTIDWDLRNNSGTHVRPGVYIYRAAVSTDNSKEATEAKKMIILW